MTEFHRAAKSAEGNPIPAGQEPRIRTQVVDFTAGAASVTLDANTYFVRMGADTLGYYTFGVSPTAVSGQDSPIWPQTPEHAGCAPNMQISIIQ